MQGLLLHKKSRALLTAFNEVLHIATYERNKPDLEAGMPLGAEDAIEAACLEDFAEFDLPIPEAIKGPDHDL